MTIARARAETRPAPSSETGRPSNTVALATAASMRASTVRLSIIVPCYNCEKTLRAAVESIFEQDSPIPFDVTMVDDGSTDRTYWVMGELARTYPQIKLLRHSTNRGGGAARNTAVANSEGDLIFCLDSDDMLGPGFLDNMAQFWLEKRCDGLGISTSVKFNKTDIRDVAYITRFENPGEPVRFDSLLDESKCSLFSTFLITRKAFLEIGGYPTDHGFDTQGMAFRFLCNGKSAFTCPETVYYHRVNFHRSYYLREERAGRNHWNMFKIFQEFLYLFKDNVKAKILAYEVFPGHAQRLLQAELRIDHERESVYRNGHLDLVRLGRDGVANALRDSEDKYDQYWLGTYCLAKGSDSSALDHFLRALQAGFNHRIIYGELLETAMRLSGGKADAALVLHDMVYHVNALGHFVESATVPVRGYQRFENWLIGQKSLRVFGVGLKSLRQSLQRIRARRAVE